MASCVEVVSHPVNLAVPAKVERHDPHLTGDLEKPVRTQFSIIVPVFNEAPLIRPFLRQLRERAPGAEIIVADGGSSDGTTQLAAGFCDQLVRSERNRGEQMNAGARVACGDILWFVHVDAEVPSGCLDEIARIVDEPKVVGGYFRIRLPRGFVYRLTDSFAHYVGILLRMRCGDHGIFCRRGGRVMYSKKRIVASPRRYEAIGRTRLTLAYGLIATLYILGFPLPKLASIYKGACCRRV